MTERLIETSFELRLTSYYTTLEPGELHKATPLLIALHGWGQRSGPFAKALSTLSDSGILCIAPQAPHQFYVDAASKKVGCNWITAYQKEQSIRDINRYLDTLIAHIIEQYDLQNSPMLLFGFSQGASVAYRFAVSGEVEIAGLIACGADIPPDAQEKLPNCTGFPILLAQGKLDTLVPEMVLETNQAILRDAQYPYEVFEYAGGHEITLELCDKMGEWIKKHC